MNIFEEGEAVPQLQWRDQLLRRFPGRDRQIFLLMNLLRMNRLSHLYIYGPSSTGKSAVISALFHDSRNPTPVSAAIINAIEYYDQKQLFENLISQIDPDYMDSPCGDINVFIQQLKYIQRKIKTPIYLIFDKAERLYANFGIEFFGILLRLEELADSNITCIFIAIQPFDNLLRCASIGLREPIPIHFPSYTESQMKNILLYLLESYYESNRYIEPNQIEYSTLLEIIKSHPNILSHFLQNIIDNFYKILTDLNELFNLTKLLLLDYSKNLQMIGNFTKPDDDIIKELYGTFNERIIEIYRSITIGNNMYFTDNGIIPPKITSYISQENKCTQALWKYMLMAAYLASHNTAKYDKQLFEPTARKSKTRKTAKTALSIAKKEGTILEKQFHAPKKFQVKRLLNLFQSIISKEPALLGVMENGFILTGTQAMVLQQVKMLVDTGMLETKQPISLDPTSQISCTADFDYIQSIATSLNFQIHHYLENPY